MGKIKVNGKRTKDNISLSIGDEVDIICENKITMPKVDILYEDANILIVNKPFGIECATRDKSSENTITLEEITADYNGIIVHRLDRLTEGLVILARNLDIARKFEKYFREGKISKYYKAFVYGKITDSGIKTAYLKKDSKNSKVTISDTELDGYKKIITEYKPIAHHNNHTLLDINLHTGRTHQIRVHSKHLGHPIVGDPVYNGKENKFGLKGQLLHAEKLELTHPTTGERMSFSAPMPDYFEEVLKKLEKK
jgi:23S rRNA pseudouridine1911/1915/1917 synthase